MSNELKDLGGPGPRDDAEIQYPAGIPVEDQAEKDAWAEDRFRQDLHDEIQARITKPSAYIPDTDGATWNIDLAAAAVGKLFETAEPAADSKLRTIDLPAELISAAKELRNAADDAVQDHEQEAADRLGFLANCVEDTSHLIVEPARMLQTLIHDRDQWQVLEKQAEEMLALTEAALGVSQKSNVALAEGQSKLIELLECVARAGEHTFKDEIAVALQRVLPEIHAVLNQVTAIETSADGRLTVAQQPEAETAPIPDAVPGIPPPLFICSREGCGKPTDKAFTLCGDCIPF